MWLFTYYVPSPETKTHYGWESTVEITHLVYKVSEGCRSEFRLREEFMKRSSLREKILERKLGRYGKPQRQQNGLAVKANPLTTSQCQRRTFCIRGSSCRLRA